MKKLSTDKQPLQFDGKTYGPLGFTNEDGPGVYYTEYTLGRFMLKYTWRPHRSTAMPTRTRIKSYIYYYRDGSRCKYCRRELTYEEATIDHYYPPRMWGKDEQDQCNKHTNLVIACFKCNLYKGDKLPNAFYIGSLDTSLRIRLIKWVLRTKTRIKLVLNGTIHIKYGHKGHKRYRRYAATKARKHVGQNND